MNYTKELEKTKVKFIIDLTSEEWEHELDHVYEHQKAKFTVEGFRKGKAPRKVIEKQYGESVFYNDAIDECFYHSMDEILGKEKVEVVGSPSLNIKKLDKTGVTLEVTMDLYPEVKLGEYKNLKIEKPEAKVSAEEVKTELNRMAEKSARIVACDGAIKKGDIAVFDFAGYIDGKEFEGGKAENYELEIGSGKFIPGFEDGMIGLKAGEEKDVVVTFPTDYFMEAMQGKVATFKVKVHAVKEKIIPEINDEFAQNVSEYDTLADYKKSIKEDLLKVKQQQADYEYEAKLLDAVTDNATVDIPESMVSEQIDMFIHDFEHRLSHSGMTLDMYLEYAHQTLDELKASRREDAIKTCKTRVVMQAIIKQEKIEVTPQDIEDELAKQALKMNTSLDEVKKGLNEQVINQMSNNIFVEKLLNFLKENNK